MQKLRTFIYLMLASAAIVAQLEGLCCDSSHTVLVPRSITHDSVYELAQNNWQFYHGVHAESYWCDIFLTPFYQESFNAEKQARYFLPNGNESIVLAQDGSGNVNPLWLNLIAGPGVNYLSTLSMKPRSSQYGLNIAIYKDFSQWLCYGLWGSIVFTPMHARNNLHLCEVQQSGTGIIPGISNAIQAFNNPSLLFGKFSACSQGRTGNDDIQLKLGYNQYWGNRDSHLGGYVVGTIPTGNHPRNEYIFEPRVGTRNGAVGFGVNSDSLMSETDTTVVSWMLDFKYRYLFSARECRSFDLCANGDWSRYLQVVTEGDNSNSMPGINGCFTQKVKVTPRSQIDVWTALHTKYCSFNWEVGYELWWRQSETIRFTNCDCCTSGIYDIVGDAGRQNAQHQQISQPITASTAQISQSVTGPNAVVSDLQFTQVGSLNAFSGSQPRSLSNTLYASCAYDTIAWDAPMFFGLGTSLEFAVGRATMDRWAVWGKWGMTF